MMYISDCVPGNWELKNPCIEERLKDEPERPVYKIKTDSGSYILKGFFVEMPETSYMQTYGPYAVDSLWKILNFGMDQKEALWEMIKREQYVSGK